MALMPPSPSPRPAETHALDVELAAWLAGPSDVDKRAKTKSLLKKYFTFCVDTNVAVFPLTIVKLMRYVIWLPQHGIHTGWNVVNNYTGAVCTLNKRLGRGDPRDDNLELWDEVRKRFGDEVQVVRNHKVKLHIPAGFLECLALDTLALPSSRRTERMSCDSIMFFAGVRVGHFAPKATTRAKHVLRWQHVVFLPSVADCTIIFFRVQTTKTRQGTVLRPYWTAVGRQLDSPLVCPVVWTFRHYRDNYLGRPGALPTDPIFSTSRGAMLGRTTYQKELQTRLLRAVTTYLPQAGFDVPRAALHRHQLAQGDGQRATRPDSGQQGGQRHGPPEHRDDAALLRGGHHRRTRGGHRAIGRQLRVYGADVGAALPMTDGTTTSSQGAVGCCQCPGAIN